MIFKVILVIRLIIMIVYGKINQGDKNDRWIINK
jgi:hypothetical protein